MKPGRGEGEIELINSGSDPDEAAQASAIVTRVDRRVIAALGLLIAGLVGILLLPNGASPTQPPPEDQANAELSRDDSPDGTDGSSSGPGRLDAAKVAQAVPRPLLSAELFNAAPSAEGLRYLLEALGGFEALTIASAEGAFDLVRFDPTDPNRLLASQRLSYGDAENQTVNELWSVTSAGEVEQEVWQPFISHDFVHYNIDGTATMWVHGGGTGFAPRVAVQLTADFEPSDTSEPMYASRFTATGGTVFALTGNGDYYTNVTGYIDLVADDGAGLQTLDDGSIYGWIDNPTPDLMIAYPADPDGLLTVWNAATLERLATHPLAGRPYQRVAISADKAVALGATFDGEVEIVELTTGRIRGAFATVDVSGVDQPLTLNHDGTIAVIVENTGRVSMWWVGDDKPIMSIPGHEAQPRWVSAEYAPRSTSVVSADASRVAVLEPARANRARTWTIVDTDPDSWIRRACAQAGRSLTDLEISALGLSDQARACAD